MARPRRRLPPVRDPLLPTRRSVRVQQSRQAAMAQINPLARELERSLSARAAAASRNITGVTGALTEQLRGYGQRVGDIYGQAEQRLGQIGQATTAQVAQAGQAQQEALAERLRLGGQSPALAQQFGALGQGAAATAQAASAGALGQLIQQGAASRAFAESLPGLAQLGGLQGIREVQARKQQQLAEGIGELRSRIPGLVSGLVRESEDREVNKAIALRGYGLDVAKLEAEARSDAAAAAARAREAALGRGAAAREKAKEREFETRKAYVQYQRDLAKARQQYEQSAKTREDNQRFQDEQRRARQEWERRKLKVPPKQLEKRGRSGRGPQPSDSPSGLRG